MSFLCNRCHGLKIKVYFVAKEILMSWLNFQVLTNDPQEEIYICATKTYNHSNKESCLELANMSFWALGSRKV